MCCHLDQVNGKLLIKAIAFENHHESGETICHIKGVFERPATFGDRVSRFFQRLELLEKIAEIADESFHLLDPLFQHYTNVMVYQTLRNLHHGAHDIEHVLHSFCFLGDISRLFTGNFWEYYDEAQKKPDYLRNLARVCHAVAHFFATIKFLNDLKLCSLGKFENAVKYTSVLSTMGYALWTISLIWRRHQGIANDQFASDLCINLGGILFEGAHSIEAINYPAHYASLLNKAASLAGIIHAWFVIQRLMPKDSEIVFGQFVMPDEEIDKEHSPHHGHHHDLDWHEVEIYPSVIPSARE